MWDELFSKNFHKLGSDIEIIKKAYLQQVMIQNHFDYQSAAFIQILNTDKHFLIDYINYLYINNSRLGRPNGERDLSIIWRINDIEPILVEAFQIIKKNDSYFGIGDHYCNVFFKEPSRDRKVK